MIDNENFDSEEVARDIERCKQDVSKAVFEQNISAEDFNSDTSMPSFEEILKKRHTAEKDLEKEFLSDMVKKISQSQNQDKSKEMPSLDLGSQILAQQRKVAAIKRKSPTAEVDKPKDRFRPAPISIQPSRPAPASPQQKIIFDIVAKNIKSLLAAHR